MVGSRASSSLKKFKNFRDVPTTSFIVENVQEQLGLPQVTAAAYGIEDHRVFDIVPYKIIFNFHDKQ